MDRTVPRTGSEDIELYIRTYYSLLRASTDVRIRTLEEAHARGPPPPVGGAPRPHGIVAASEGPRPRARHVGLHLLLAAAPAMHRPGRASRAGPEPRAVSSARGGRRRIVDAGGRPGTPPAQLLRRPLDAGLLHRQRHRHRRHHSSADRLPDRMEQTARS